jgi:dihydroneopterin aldolase
MTASVASDVFIYNALDFSQFRESIAKAAGLFQVNTIFVQELRVETRIGVYAWERQLCQTLVIDLELALPSAKAFASDDFADALDYAAVVKRVQAFAADHPHKLLERFAEALADVLRAEFGSPWVKVSVAKLAPVAGVRRVGVVIERGER